MYVYVCACVYTSVVVIDAGRGQDVSWVDADYVVMEKERKRERERERERERDG